MSKIRLGDIADIQAGPFGTQLHKDEYVDKGIPMLNSKNIGNGSIVTSSLDYVSPSICSRLPNYVLKTGDILFGRAGTIERHAYLPAQYNGCFQGTNCIRIRCYDEKKALFISYFLWTKQVKQTIENSAGGSIPYVEIAPRTWTRVVTEKNSGNFDMQKVSGKVGDTGDGSKDIFYPGEIDGVPNPTASDLTRTDVGIYNASGKSVYLGQMRAVNQLPELPEGMVYATAPKAELLIDSMVKFGSTHGVIIKYKP